ncbi:nuclear transport factor 2 family protein [Actinophytocola sediminis]
MTDTTAFANRVADYFLGHGENHELWAEDLVIESPFARTDRQRRYVGRQKFLDATRESREALPVRFEEFRDVTVHDAGETLVIEYELAGTVLTTGKKASARFIAVARVRGEQVTHWREYPDTQAITEALGDSWR